MNRPLTALCLLLPTTALANPPSLDPSWRPSDGALELRQEAATSSSSGPNRVRGYDMEVSFRTRMLSVPDSILDIWYFDKDDPGWADTGRGRPDIRGYGLGLEFVVKGDSANGIFYFDYLDSTMQEGYWDDREEPPDHLDGDFLEPSANLGLVALGANYAYEVHFLRTEDTNGNFGLSFLVGGGLGVGFMMGELQRWGPNETGDPSFVLYDRGEPSVGRKQIPRVYPMVDLNAGLRFNFGDRAVIRIEGGLHTLLYYGATAGIMF